MMEKTKLFEVAGSGMNDDKTCKKKERNNKKW